MNKAHYLIHLTVYYIAWFAGITLAAQGYPWRSTLIVGVCIVLQLYWQYKSKSMMSGVWRLLLIILFFSSLIDSLLIYKGIIIYSANPFAPYFTSPWMIGIWLSFTVLLYATLSGLFSHLFLLGILSWLGFAVAFYLGARLGAAFFPYGTVITCFFIGAIWAFVLPFCVYCYRKQALPDNSGSF
ncbi:MAG: DUF2878 domain-containing protein [Legionella sp.]|nr:DUF2878 domain-containing protein [Legionella sp.]